MRPDFGGGVLVATYSFAYKPADPDNYSNQPSEETILRTLNLLE